MKQSEKKLSNLLVRRVAVFFSDRTRVIAERQFSLSVGRWRVRKSFFSLSMPRAFQKLPFFCLFYPLHKAFAFFFCCSSETKGKEFSFCDETKRSNNKGGQAIKEVVSFFYSFQVKQKGTVFLHCWCFFLADGNVLFFENKNRQTGQQFRKSVKREPLKQQQQLLLFLFLSTCLKAQEQEQKKS